MGMQISSIHARYDRERAVCVFSIIYTVPACRGCCSSWRRVPLAPSFPANMCYRFDAIAPRAGGHRRFFGLWCCSFESRG